MLFLIIDQREKEALLKSYHFVMYLHRLSNFYLSVDYSGVYWFSMENQAGQKRRLYCHVDCHQVGIALSLLRLLSPILAFFSATRA